MTTESAAPRRMYPGGYIACESSISGENFMRGKWRKRCLMPAGHDGPHWNGDDRSYSQWEDSDAD